MSRHEPRLHEEDEPAIGAETVAAVEASREHASDLIAAAKLLQEPFPHLAYHFAVLALEEIGRGVLLVVRASVAQADGETWALETAMEDHVLKLFWALWSPTQAGAVSGTQIEEFRELARQIHEVRKEGLYFDPTVASLPRQAVSLEEATTVIGLAESRVGMETAKRWAPSGSQQAADVRWFGEAASDPRLRTLLFSGPSLAKLSELRDVPRWIQWLRKQDEASEDQAKEAVARELARQRPEDAEAAQEKWRLSFRLFSESHSIRARPLNTWNEHNDWIKLRRANSDELIVELTMPKAVLADTVWPAGFSLAQTLLLALNIGSMGFFWWSRRTNTSRFYEQLRDLERNQEAVIERAPPLIVDWGRGQVLDEQAIHRVLLCFAMLAGDKDRVAENALGHYLRGLALIAKSDVHLEFTINIFQEFHEALRAAMSAYGEWNTTEPYSVTFEAFATPFFTDATDRSTYVRATELAEAGQLDEIKLGFGEAVIMKGLADAFFLPKLRELASERAAAEASTTPLI
jgi:AbiV family abortive infection protein